MLCGVFPCNVLYGFGACKWSARLKSHRVVSPDCFNTIDIGISSHNNSLLVSCLSKTYWSFKLFEIEHTLFSDDKEDKNKSD